MKQCNICKIEKQTTEFHKNSGAKDGLSGRCKDCAKAYNKAWQAANPEKARESWRKAEKKSRDVIRKKATKYGLTKAELEAMILLADGRCELCGTECSLHIDHCHESNKVRGLLCLQCNTALGNFKDDVDLLNKAITYLQKNMGV